MVNNEAAHQYSAYCCTWPSSCWLRPLFPPASHPPTPSHTISSRRGLPTRLAAIPLVYTLIPLLCARQYAACRHLPASSVRLVVARAVAAEPYGGLRRRGELGGVRGGVLVDGVPAAAGAAPQALLRLLQPRSLHHARRHRRRPRLPLRAGLGLPRLPGRLALLSAPGTQATRIIS